MLQRVGLAQALINDPELIFLDEPMSGLDPLGRYQVKDIILSLKQQGKTIFFNSHVLTDVEQICDRIALLARGKILCMGSLEELLGRSDVYQVIVQGGNQELLKPWLAQLTEDSLTYGNNKSTESGISPINGFPIRKNLWFLVWVRLEWRSQKS
jgi:ABC-2 type transport system ATP-binding protein